MKVSRVEPTNEPMRVAPERKQEVEKALQAKVAVVEENKRPQIEPAKEKPVEQKRERNSIDSSGVDMTV